MKKSVRILGIILILATVLSLMAMTAMAAETIDTASSSKGAFTVYYVSSAKLKVGVTYGGKTTYYNYTSGEKSTFSFDKGDGSYTVKVFENVSGTSYRTVSTKDVSVKLDSEYAQYLVSTNDITFAEGDAVSKKAAELCKGLTTNSAKVVAIYSYIVDNYTYDKDFAAKVNNGTITTYTPDTEAIVGTNKGVCWDFASLFAAMCRSQEIPCAVTTGYTSGKYHAWNKVNVDGSWYQIDLTYSVNSKLESETLSGCVSPITNYTNASDSIVTAA